MIPQQPTTAHGDRGPARGDRGSEPTEVTLLGLVNVVLRRRSWVVGAVAATFIVATLVAALGPRQYSSSASFVPQTRRAPNNLSGLAAQFGVALPISDPAQSPRFYADLLETRQILGAAVDAGYTFQTDTGQVSGTLVELLGARGESPALRRDEAMMTLRDRVRISVSQQTGLVTLTVTDRRAPVAQQVVARMLELVNEFNLESRRSQAEQEREFTERRLTEVREDLRRAENRLQSFFQQNRAYENSPELRLEQDRLARDVSLRQQVYTTLSQAYEQAKIEEVRDTPVITIVERPAVAVRPNSRGLVKTALLALGLGFVLGLGLAFIREYFGRSGDDSDDELEEFSALRRQAVDDITHPWRPVARLLSRRKAVG